MHFKDRIDAGKKLIPSLLHYKNNSDVVVIGLPRGGVPVAFEIARALNVPLDIVVPRKIGMPGQEEFAVGALTEDGTVQLNEVVLQEAGVTREDLEPTIKQEKKEAQRRLKLYRGNRPPLDLKNKIAVIVDDGIATGSTMQAAIASARAHGAQKIVMVIPVAPPDTLAKLSGQVDDVVCLYSTPFFGAVGSFYDVFGQTEDDEVIALLRRAMK